MLKLDVWFNKQCKVNNVTPKYINIKYKGNSKTGDYAVYKAKSIWLNLEIRNLYSKIKFNTEKMYQLQFRNW